jgi:hypothetical protein
LTVRGLDARVHHVSPSQATEGQDDLTKITQDSTTAHAAPAGEAVRAAFRQQVEACGRLGSPFTARLCRLAAERLRPAHGRAAARVLAWGGDPGPRGHAVPLRLMGALHALVLTGTAPELAAVYPPNPAPPSDDALWDAVAAALGAHDDFVFDWLDSPPQTNEVQRSSGLFCGLMHLSRRFGLPFVLSEAGCSAGLNLNLERYAYRLGDRTAGAPDSRLVLIPDLTGVVPPLAEVAVAERAGCDLNPLDPRNPEHALRLKAFVWADQLDRMERLARALEIAAAHPPPVARADAVAWIAERLATPRPGHCHVVFHTIALQYFPPDAKAAFADAVERALAAAPPEAPVTWLQMESDDRHPGAALTLRTSAAPDPAELARVDFHGRWVEWRAS